MRTLFLLLTALPILAHQQPTTLATLDLQDHHVSLTLHLPVSELELATSDALPAYLATHIRPLAPDGRPWQVQVRATTLQRAEQTQTGTFQEVVAQLQLTPPPNAPTRQFTLHYDAILHQVVTHKAIVSTRAHTQIGVIQVNHETGRIAPLEIRLEPTTLWSGFPAMLRLGMDHIREGTDHMLFLLVLLLPAILTPKKILQIVTAFTLGHSLTLLAAAFGWFRLPQQPVEALIAVSILLSAMHAIRPLFPGREPHVAAAFGLVHGLAFATALTDLQLSAAPLAVSILGFNLGIELMQLFIVALVAPWLVLLSLSPFSNLFRITGATLVAIASLGWIAQRLTGQSNLIEQRLQTLPEVAPLAVLLLAMLAIPTYLLAPNQKGNHA